MTSKSTVTGDLLPRVAAGEAGMAEAMLTQYGGLVWSLARRFLMNEADAEDAVQDIFVELWRMADRFNPAIGSETAFVAMIARRRLIDRRRRASRRPEAVSGVALDALGGSSARASETDEVAKAGQALIACSKAQQDVLRLALVEGMPQEKIARVLGLPLGTVKTHARRALIKVREAVGAETREREVAS